METRHWRGADPFKRHFGGRGDFGWTGGSQAGLDRAKAAFLRHVPEKMLAYALGRGLELYDMLLVKRISDTLVHGEARTTELILEVVRSHPFQYRRGSDATAEIQGRH